MASCAAGHVAELALQLWRAHPGAHLVAAWSRPQGIHETQTFPPTPGYWDAPPHYSKASLAF